MKVSIIIPNYNGAKYIKECIDSVYNQTYKDYELIVVDNASSDNSNEIIEENYPEIKLIKNDTNTGFSIAVNQGIKESKGEYALLLNNDTLAEPTWLEALVNTIEKDKKIFSVCSKMIQYYNNDKIDDAGDEYCVLGWAWKRGDGKSTTEYTKTEEVFSSCAGAAIYRKATFDEIGYFDENFFAYMEDVDISYRAKIYGYKNVYCADAKIHHIGSATSGSKYNGFKIKLAARNNIYVPYKNMPLLQLIINFIPLLLGVLVKYMFFKKIGFHNEYVEGLKDGIRTLSKVEKVRIHPKNIFNYVKIEFQLILNMFKYIGYKLKR